METKIAGMSDQWWTAGMIFKDRLVCQFHKSGFSGGILVGDSPLNNPTSVVLFQMCIIFIFTRTLYFLFQPLRQTMIVAHIVAGLILGPTTMSHHRVVANKLFPPPGRYILKTLSSFGFMLHLFIMGVKIDMSAIRSTGIKSLLIGLSGFLFSLLFGGTAFYFVRQNAHLDQNLFTGIRLLITFNSLTFFMVTSGYINDLKFSNSDIGRLACSSALIVDIMGLFGTTLFITWFDTSNIQRVAPQIMNFISISLYYMFLFCICRPMVLYVVSKTPEGATTMKQKHLMMVLVILMVAWLGGENYGQRFATFLFGLSLPDGPPLGSALVQKFELFTSGILLPVFCTMAGWRTNLNIWKDPKQLWVVEIILVIGHLGKLLGTILSSAAVGLSFQDALSLSLMMSLKGIMEVATYNAWNDRGLLEDRLYTLSMLNIVIFTGVAYPFVQHLYDPSKQYTTIKKKGVASVGDNTDLQVLVCIHNEESVPGIVNLLKLVNNVGATLSIFTLQLMNLTGSSMPILEPFYKYKKSSTTFTHYEHAVNAFDQLEKESRGLARVQHFVSVTPYKSMHNDICSLAHDKRTSIILAPFYKRWGVHGTVEACSAQIKEVDKSVIRKAPCSVAILIDKKGPGAASIPLSVSLLSTGNVRCNYQIAMLFIGGSDDHEALALASRMAEHPSVRLTVVWLRSHDYQPPLEEFEEDVRVMTEFHKKAKKNDRIAFGEQFISDGIGTTKTVLSMENADLFIVGKYHEPECPAIQGLIAWNESPEIGALGDMLATSDFLFSILVVQQQPQLELDVTSSRHSKADDLLSLSSFNDTPKSTKSHWSLGV